MLDNVAARGAELFGMLHGLKQDAVIGDTLAEVRGLGLVSRYVLSSCPARGSSLADEDAAWRAVAPQMVGVEFKSPTDPYTPSATGASIPAKMASRVQAKCLENDLLTLTTSVYETMVRRASEARSKRRLGTLTDRPCADRLLLSQRFIPPLNVSKQELADGCGIIEKAITDVVREG